jgi:glycosyltransferase involved in cell wall biosynthesis
MSGDTHPLVSIVTPMYNNAEYLRECIESVREQTYPNWHYVIVNNCSTDGSAEIAHEYARLDPRIRVHDNQEFLPVVANHNLAMRQISPSSKYTKMVFSDDWLFPSCLEDMVTIGESHPHVGIVGAYGIQGDEVEVKWSGLPYPSASVPGREICRRYFLDGVYVFGTSHSLLFRSDLVRSRENFFNESNIHADREVCVDLLRNCDFGFVHQILTYTRERRGSLTAYSRTVNTNVGGRLYELNTYGGDFLSQREYLICRRKLLDEYYNYLAVSRMLGGRDSKFWNMHKTKLVAAGFQFSYYRLLQAMLARWWRALWNPAETLHKIRCRRGSEIPRAKAVAHPH